jgi:DNA-binding GntR family transcriptional regulator
VVSRSQDRYIDGGAVRYLAEELGVRQSGYRDWITGRLATEEEQSFFGIGHNAAVFVDSRIAFYQDNSPMWLTVTIFPVNLDQLVINVGPNVPPLRDTPGPRPIK